MVKEPSSRDNALEALRGLAAVSVLAWHSMLGFFPERSGLFPYLDPAQAINTRVWFGLVYGSSSVSFFFVLSGFVLTRYLFVSGDASQIYRNAIKRLPRLAFPVLITVLLSYLAFRLNLYSHRTAGLTSRSAWLYHFANASQEPVPSFVDALKQGSYRTFFRGDEYYDSSLWTMRYEFIGSLVAFGLALLVQPIERTGLRVYLIVVVALLCHWIDPLYVAFPLGVALAALLPSRRIDVRPLATAGLVFGYVYLAGYAGLAAGAFRPFVWLAPANIPPPYVNMTGAVLLLIAAETSQGLRSFLSRPWGTFLGRVSFPLYLVHVPVLCSAGCAAFLALVNRFGAPLPQVAAVAVTVAVSFALAYPLTRASEWWVLQLNRVVARIAPRAAAPRASEARAETAVVSA
jgi:peptidoglycan/LPS O-acetylase OafA/YrhL